MKKLILTISLVCGFLSAIVLFREVIRINYSNELFRENVEVLAQGEGAVITCSNSYCGRCFDIKTAWPFYRCIWTGVQTDYCDCDKVGWTGV